MAIRAALVLGIALALGVPASAGPPPNVLVVLIDTLRADRLGVYGNRRRLTPFMDGLAARGTLFEHAYATSCWTVPSVSSLFTSRYPSQHHMVGFFSRLPDSEVTLAKRLRDAGWTTGGFVANPTLQARFGYGKGFAEWHVAPLEEPAATAGDRVRDNALQWLDRVWHRGADQPVFLYVHYMEPHAPYEPPEPFRSRFFVDDHGKPLDMRAVADALWADVAPRWLLGSAEPMLTVDPAALLAEERLHPDAMREHLVCRRPEDDTIARLLQDIDDRQVLASARLYDGEVAAVDEQLRLLFAALETRGFLDRAVTIVTADHGEEFMEHGGLGHARALYEESVHVPLLVSTAGSPAGKHVAENVSLVDVAPTVLDILHLGAEPAFEGRSLAQVAARDVVLEFEPVWPNSVTFRPHARGLVRGRRKVLMSPSGRPTAYDLATDPGEQRGGPVSPGSAAAAMASALEVAEKRLAARASGTAPVGAIDDALAKRLRALGYVQ